MRRRVKEASPGRAAVLLPPLALLFFSSAGACGLDLVGTGDGPDDAGPVVSTDAPVDRTTPLVDAGGDGASDIDADDGAVAVDAPPKDVATDTTPFDACPVGGCPPAATCRQILATTPPPVTSGLYTVDPDGVGPNAPFQVWCDMTIDGGGWTLIGREISGGMGTFRFLKADTGNTNAIATGGQSGIIGVRFLGLYTDVWVDWATSYVRFTKPATFDLFANVVNTAVPLLQTSTNDTRLNGWLTSAGGGKLCVAARYSDIKPGDTSWAIVPLDDNNTGCGCNSASWVGRGAYYGGTQSGQTVCGGNGGGWAGVKDTSEQKGGLSQPGDTKLWIR